LKPTFINVAIAQEGGCSYRCICTGFIPQSAEMRRSAHQLKARAGAREIEQKLVDTKLEVQQGKQDLKARVQQEGAGAMQGIMPALMSSGKKP
jgi:hypothetical protein